MNNCKNGLLTILLLIGITSAALAYMGSDDRSVSSTPAPVSGSGEPEIITIHTALAQDKVLKGTDGSVSVALTLDANNVPLLTQQNIQPVDLVVVLDRSGSMNGQKISYAKEAVIRLMNRLTVEDRMSIVTYSNGVEILSPLVKINKASRDYLSGLVNRIYSGGGTNLGGGLKNGIAMLTQDMEKSRQRKVILISDGLANHGITNPAQLGAMASNGSEYNLTTSTVGVGYDFNEVLMTTIADHGAGNYYYLENPHYFSRIFEKEFETARTIAAGAIEIRIPLKDGIHLVGAGGYPIRIEDNVASIRPGNLLAGQQRKIFLSYQVPTDQVGDFSLGTIEVHYQHAGVSMVGIAPEKLGIACVQDQQEVIASIDETVWTEQVLKEDYGRLKEHVATAIRTGKKEVALEAIAEYEDRTSTINSSVDSDKISQNLEKDVRALRQSVDTTFAGAPAAVAEKKKQQAKALQYESYQVRRDKK